jgi:hypothetical protein
MRRTSGFKGISASTTNPCGVFCFDLAGRGIVYNLSQKAQYQNTDVLVDKAAIANTPRSRRQLEKRPILPEFAATFSIV